MKKFLKTALAVTLGGMFAFSGFACEKGNNSSVPDSSSNTSDSSSNTSDSSSSIPDSSVTDPSKATEESLAYVNGALTQFGKTKSVKISISMDMTADYERSENSVKTNGTSKNKAEGEIILSKTETSLNAKFFSKQSYYNDETDNGQGEFYGYLIDGVLYSSEDNVNFVSEEFSFEDIFGMQAGSIISAIMDQVNFDPNEIVAAISSDEAKNQLGLLLDQYGEKTGDELAVKTSIDLRSTLTTILMMINSINEAEMTVETAINNILAMLPSDPTADPLTVKSILDMVGSMGGMTVDMIYTILDATVQEQTGLTLQQVYDQLVASEEFMAIISAIPDLPEGFAEQLKALKFADLLDMEIEEGKTVRSLTIDEVVAIIMEMIQQPNNPEEVPQTMAEVTEGGEEESLLATMTAQLYAMLSTMTLQEAGIVFPAWDNVMITAAKADAEIDFAADKTLKSIGGKVEFSVNGLPVEYGEDQPYYFAITGFALKANVKAEEFSDQVIAIALPEGAVVVPANSGTTNPTLAGELWTSNF